MIKKRFTLGLRILLWIWIGIVALFSLVILFFLFLPDAYILHQIEIQSKAVGWPVSCEDFQYRPFGSFDFHGIMVAFQPDSSSPPIPFLHIDRIKIRARIWPLLFRKISVASVVIENPRFSFSQNLSQKINSVSPQQPTRKTKPFFRGFSLDTLGLQNFTLRMDFPSGNVFRTLEWKGLNVHASRFSLSNLAGGFSLFTEKSRLKMDSKWGRKEFTPQLTLHFLSQKQGQWKMDLKTALFLSKREKRILGLRLNAHGEKDLGQGVLDSTEFFLGAQRVLQASGRFSWDASMAEFHIQSFPLALGPLRLLFSEIFPDSVFNSLQVGGEIRLCSGKILGRKNQFLLDLHSQWREIMLEGFSPFQIKGFEGSLDVVKDSVQTPVRVKGKAVFPWITLGTLPEIKNTKLAWALDMENGFSSHTGKISGIMENLWDGRGEIQAFWETRDFPQTKNLTGQATFGISGIELATLSGSPKMISGKLHGRGEFQLFPGGKGKGELCFSLPKLVFDSQGKRDSLPPVDFRMFLQGIAQEDFQKWKIDYSKIEIGQFFEGRVEGEIDLQRRMWEFRLKQGVFENVFLVTHLPFSFLEKFEGIKASGKEILEIGLSGNPKGTEIQGSFSIESGTLELPFQDLRLQEVQGQMDFQGNEKQLAGNGKLVLGNVVFSQIRPDPFLENQCEFSWTWKSPDRFEILQSRIVFPSIAMESELQGKAEHFSNFPTLGGEMVFRFSSSGPIRITPSFSLYGNFETKTKIQTTDFKKGHVEIKGNFVLDSLHVNIVPFLEIQNIYGELPFSFHFDPIQKKWISPKVSRKYPLRTYPVEKSWFSSFSPNLSTLTVEKIKWRNYTLDHIQMDMDFSEGMFDVPRFRLEVLGGNGAGSVRVEMREGFPLWNIQADFGQINSATLVHGLKPGEETELNASMYFQGQGINPQADFDLNGNLHITQIGPAFISTLLEAIDPKGADRNIRLTRRLLSMGSKPKRFSFEIRHGYVYPSLELDQPWYSPLPIPEKIQYGRLPLVFFLQSSQNREALR